MLTVADRSIFEGIGIASTVIIVVVVGVVLVIIASDLYEKIANYVSAKHLKIVVTELTDQRQKDLDQIIALKQELDTLRQQKAQGIYR